MSRRKKSKCDDVEFENSHLEKIVESLAHSMAQMQTSISDLAVSIQSQNQNRIDQHDVGRSTGDVSSKQYISIWRDLGGGAVYFCPGGSLHPMQFLNKIERLFNDAGVPEEAKVGLAMSCLKQSAADWAMNKEQKLGCYDDFRRAFRERYWNAEHERALYYDLKYGEYMGGNRGDYLLKVAGSASYLSNPIPESDLVQMLVDHFPSEIKRGVVLNGIKNLDHFERYLRMLDGTYEEDRRRGGSRGVFRPPQVRNSSNINSTSRDEGQHRGNTREIRYLTAFNAEPEALLSDPEEEVVEENFKSPVFRGIVGEEFTDILIDSGSQISAVSQDFVNQLRDKGVLIHSLPISDVSVSIAVGGKKYRVKEQVLLSVDVESGDQDNRMADSLSRNPLPRITCSSPDMKNSVNVALMNIERIVSDNATQFHSKLWKRELTSFNIQVCHTSAYFPEGNMTERANREIGRVLRALCAERHTKWAVYLDQIEDCLNNVVHESTGFSPSWLHFGRETPSLVNTFFKLPGSELPKPDLQCTWSLVHERLKSNAEKRKKKLNDKTTEFEVGDAVLVRQHPISSAMDASIKKFFLLHEGPYWVSKVVAPNCYQVIDKDGVVIGRHNIKNLKKFVSFNGIS
nr:unnamed protein product [Callosobruchus analis]